MTIRPNLPRLALNATLLAAVALVLGFVGSAAAATRRYASPNGTSTPSTCTNRAAPCSLSAALVSAQGGDDVSLAAGTYDVSGVPLPPVPLHWISTDPRQRPVLTSAASAPTLVLTPAQSGSSFQGLEIDNTSASSSVLQPALQLQSGVAAAVRASVVKGRHCIDAPHSGALAIEGSMLSATAATSCLDLGAMSTVRTSVVSIPAQVVARESPPPSATTAGVIEDTTVGGGLSLDGPTAIARRVRAVGPTGISGQGLVADSLAQGTAPDGAAIAASAPLGGTLRVVNSTAVNPHGPALLAPPVFALREPVAPNDLEVTDSIARGGTVDIQVTDGFACALGATCRAGHMGIDHSDFATRAPLASARDGALITRGAGNLAADPLFADAGRGDFHLRRGSPAIDAGVSDGRALPTDLDGHLRLQGAAPDLGAFESPRSVLPSRPPAPPHVAPVLSHLKIRPRAIHASRSPSRRARRGAAGITFTLSEKATVRLSFAKAQRLRRCRRASGRARVCTRHLTAGSLTVHGRRGTNANVFAGVVSRRRLLAPGTYRLTATPVAGTRTGRARTVQFTVLRGRA